MEKIICPTLSYCHVEFLEFAAKICQWAANENIYASLPTAWSHNGRQYLSTQFGHCPSDSGVTGWFAWDDLNREYLFWETESMAWDFTQSEAHNLDHLEPLRFATLLGLESYLVNGDLPS